MAKKVKSYNAYRVMFLSNEGSKLWFQPSRKFGKDSRKAMTFDNDSADLLVATLAKNTPDVLSQGTLVVEPVKPTPSYNNAVDFIANMDEATSLDAEYMSAMPSVFLVSELFGLTRMQVAEDVVALRRKFPKRQVS